MFRRIREALGFGNQEEKEKIRFFKCPGCETEFTGEMVLTATDHEIVWENN